MEMKIYEDQTGLMLPHHEEKDEKTVTFFNKSVDLYIAKKDEMITIYCFVLAHKGLARDQGYYIVSDYSDITYSVFKELKKNATKLLHDLELQPRQGDTDNAIFDNLDKFDLKEYSYAGNIYKDIDIISDIIYKDPNRCLDYRGSNIVEILIFCYQLLKIKNVKIAVSSEEMKLCNINILRNKKTREHLSPSDTTIQILDNAAKNINSEIIKNENIAIDNDRKKRTKKRTISHIILIIIFGIIMIILGIVIGTYLIKHYGIIKI